MPAADTRLLPPGVTFMQRAWMSSNTIVIRGNKTVVIDPGHVLDWEETAGRLAAETGLRPADVDVLWLTHAHSDHAGGTRRFQEAGAEVWAHPITARRANAWDLRETWVGYADQVHERFSVDREIPDGAPVALGGLTLEPIHAPGHALGMVALYCPEHRFLITADALCENGFGPLVAAVEGEDVLDRQRETVARLAALDVSLVLPGHGPAFTDLAGACARAVSRLDAYAADPRRLARSGFKGYLVHHLFEVGGMRECDMVPYLSGVAGYVDYATRYFPGMPMAALWERIRGELVAQGAIAQDGERLLAVGRRP